MNITWHTFEDAAAVAQQASKLILEAGHQAIQLRGIFRLALAGGTTPQMAYQLLAEAKADWRYWDIWFGDERCVPADDSERNSIMATNAWLAHVPIPQQNIHVIGTESGAAVGAAGYAAKIARVLPLDMAILGVGEDGHTASLFPGQHASSGLTVTINNAPKPPPSRISLSEKVLSRSRRLLVIVTGEEKRDAVKRWRAKANLPISRITAAASSVDVLMDRAAADA